jgi:hypothetical protein
MNDYVATFLAADRVADFGREAARDRRASEARLVGTAPARPDPNSAERRLRLRHQIARMRLSQSHG